MTSSILTASHKVTAVEHVKQGTATAYTDQRSPNSNHGRRRQYQANSYNLENQAYRKKHALKPIRHSGMRNKSIYLLLHSICTKAAFKEPISNKQSYPFSDLQGTVRFWSLHVNADEPNPSLAGPTQYQTHPFREKSKNWPYSTASRPRIELSCFRRPATWRTDKPDHPVPLNPLAHCHGCQRSIH